MTFSMLQNVQSLLFSMMVSKQIKIQFSAIICCLAEKEARISTYKKSDVNFIYSHCTGVQQECYPCDV
uniref:Uncharacterized protein n=1 Tax=Anguilla anguilla TaxID=7936 RepID=A0A0E9X7W4_ANGAN